jgi:uncharacterized protein
MGTLIARWQDWLGRGLEHLVLMEEPERIVTEAAILGNLDNGVFAAHYLILCDPSWSVKESRLPKSILTSQPSSRATRL